MATVKHLSDLKEAKLFIMIVKVELIKYARKSLNESNLNLKIEEPEFDNEPRE